MTDTKDRFEEIKEAYTVAIAWNDHKEVLIRRDRYTWLIQEVERLRNQVEWLINKENEEIKSKVREIESLTKERDELKHKITRGPSRIQELEAENAELKNKKLRAEQLGWVEVMQDEVDHLKKENAELKKKVEPLQNVANIAAQCCIDLESNLKDAHKEYMAGDISKGAYDYVLSRHGAIHESLHKAGYTEKHKLYEFPVRPK